MNPIKVFASIFAAGLVLTVALGIIGLTQDDQLAEDGVENGGAVEEPVAQDPEALIQQACISCHGADLSGGMGPSLLDMEIDRDEIIDVLVHGAPNMPGGLADGMEEEVADYLLSIQD